MAGTLRLSDVGQSEELMEMGLLMEAAKRTEGEKVGRPCSKRL
jgi:hypothetical protein